MRELKLRKVLLYPILFLLALLINVFLFLPSLLLGIVRVIHVFSNDNKFKNFKNSKGKVMFVIYDFVEGFKELYIV